MVPRRNFFILVAVAFCCLFLGAGQENPSSPKEVTYNRDVLRFCITLCLSAIARTTSLHVTDDL